MFVFREMSRFLAKVRFLFDYEIPKNKKHREPWVSGVFYYLIITIYFAPAAFNNSTTWVAFAAVAMERADSPLVVFMFTFAFLLIRI
jgi:hypothetical protein